MFPAAGMECIIVGHGLFALSARSAARLPVPIIESRMAFLRMKANPTIVEGRRAELL